MSIEHLTRTAAITRGYIDIDSDNRVNERYISDYHNKFANNDDNIATAIEVQLQNNITLSKFGDLNNFQKFIDYDNLGIAAKERANVYFRSNGATMGRGDKKSRKHKSKKHKSRKHKSRKHKSI